MTDGLEIPLNKDKRPEPADASTPVNKKDIIKHAPSFAELQAVDINA